MGWSAGERTDGLINRPVALKLPHGAWKRRGSLERMARESGFSRRFPIRTFAHLYDAGVTATGALLAIGTSKAPHRVYCSRAASRCGGAAAPVRAGGRCGRVWHTASWPFIATSSRRTFWLAPGRSGSRPVSTRHRQTPRPGPGQETRFTELSRRRTDADLCVAGTDRWRTAHRCFGLYSLGVVLFELLAGSGRTAAARLRAHSKRPFCSRIRRCRASVVESPRRSALRGDPRHRGAQGAQNETVRALPDRCPPARGHRALSQLAAGARAARSRWYRAKKFIARNTLAVSATAAIAVALIQRRRRRRLASAPSRSRKRRAPRSAGLHRVVVPRGRPDEAARVARRCRGGIYCSRPNAA